MSEQQTPEPETTEETVEEFQPITSQDALNKLIGERIAGVKKYADYDQLRSKATNSTSCRKRRNPRRRSVMNASIASRRNSSLNVKGYAHGRKVQDSLLGTPRKRPGRRIRQLSPNG